MSGRLGHVHLRPMTLADVADVVFLGQVAKLSPWPAAAYERELVAGSGAHYLVACQASGSGAAAGPMPVVGFGGLLIQVDEAHVTALAVVPDCRRRGIGGRLLARLLWLAIETQAVLATLEVRASNLPAQNLYAKFGFREVGRRRGYYPDSREDALIMSTPDLADPTWLTGFETLSRALGGRYTDQGAT